MNQELVMNTRIEVCDDLAAHLGGPKELERFSISILDAAKLSGHLCPSVTGAFLATRAAVKALFPETQICKRGMVRIDIAGSATEGANGPIGHIMSYITGAWSESGFGGLRGEFVRRNLLHFNSKKVAPGKYRFERTDTGKVVEVAYHPGNAKLTHAVGTEFSQMWQARIQAILASPDVIEIHEMEV